MNSEIVRRHNSIVTPNDDVYVLGDLMLGTNSEENIKLINSMNGHKIVIRGNHDSDNRVKLYKENGMEVYDAKVIKHNGYHFYLSHYPTITSNLEKETLKQCLINLYGHTHQRSNFYSDIPWMYHTGVDSHNCVPCNLDMIIEEIKIKAKECISYL